MGVFVWYLVYEYDDIFVRKATIINPPNVRLAGNVGTKASQDHSTKAPKPQKRKRTADNALDGVFLGDGKRKTSQADKTVAMLQAIDSSKIAPPSSLQVLQTRRSELLLEQSVMSQTTNTQRQAKKNAVEDNDKDSEESIAAEILEHRAACELHVQERKRNQDAITTAISTESHDMVGKTVRKSLLESLNTVTPVKPRAVSGGSDGEIVSEEEDGLERGDS